MRLGPGLLYEGRTLQGARPKLADFCSATMAEFYSAVDTTIVECADQDLAIVRNELFGPVLSVLRFRDEEEAIHMARDSDYAFAGGVFSQDFGKAYRTARAIPAGRFWINTYRVTSYTMPFGGSANSGYGREGGIEAIHDYTQSKAIFADLSGEKVADPFVMR